MNHALLMDVCHCFDQILNWLDATPSRSNKRNVYPWLNLKALEINPENPSVAAYQTQTRSCYQTQKDVLFTGQNIVH